MEFINEDGDLEEVGARELRTIEQVLKGCHDNLLSTADYLEYRGVLTREEVLQLDRARQLLASKILILTG